VYADVLMGINFAFNFYLLWLTAMAARFRRSPARLALGALLGAAFSLPLLLPRPLPGLLSLSFPLLMLLAVFYPFTLGQGLQLVAIFYGVTFLSCGALMALQFLAYRGDFAAGARAFLVPSPTLLPVLLAFFMAAALVRLTWVGVRNRRPREAWRGQVCLRRRGKEITLAALVDTGNSLREPVSGAPVVIAHYRELLPLLEGLPPLKAASREGRLEELTRELSACLDSGIFIVPYRSLGKEGGYLPGFRPEEVEVKLGERSHLWRRGQVVVCLSPDRVSREGEPLALVHPDLICGGGSP
jgi:stage II sporulation protein GA (sporulation sigma-E factor processing peptidase)